MYHSSIDTKIESFRAGSCFVADADVSETFLCGNAGRVYEVAIESSSVAYEDELREAGAQCGFDGSAYLFELADDSAVRANLAAQEYTTVEYADTSEDNMWEFTCIRTLVDGIVTIK